jgi:hypothetical protein
VNPLYPVIRLSQDLGVLLSLGKPGVILSALFSSLYAFTYIHLNIRELINWAKRDRDIRKIHLAHSGLSPIHGEP